eukprot:9231711-Pyramimonas_sp.AAC.1
MTGMTDPWEHSDPWQNSGTLTLGGAPTSAYPVMQHQSYPMQSMMQTSAPGEALGGYMADYDDWSSSGTSGEETPHAELE